MSTDLSRNTRFGIAAGDSSACFSLRALQEELKAVRDVPTLQKLTSWLQQVQSGSEELRPYVAFKPGTYARHRVFRNEHVELLVLCWRPGQRTPIHDHNGSHGAVRVLQGVMWETVFVQDSLGKLRYETAQHWKRGEVTGADVPDIHQLGNPDVSGQDLLTLHLYAPPLGVLNTYKVGSSEVGHYTPDEYMDGGGI